LPQRTGIRTKNVGRNLIQDTLECIRQRLNGYFQVADPAAEDWVILSNIVDQDGHMFEQARNKVVVFLANIQHDTTVATWNVTAPAGPNRYSVVQPALYINLFVLFFANFSGTNYPQGLGMISRTIQFFQENPCFDHQNMPDLPPPIDKLAFEFTNLDSVGLNYLMGLAGVKYLPSVYYKVRMLPFRTDAIQEQVPAAQGHQVPDAPADPRSEQGQAG
jgi:hypothetical protein